MRQHSAVLCVVGFFSVVVGCGNPVRPPLPGNDMWATDSCPVSIGSVPGMVRAHVEFQGVPETSGGGCGTYLQPSLHVELNGGSFVGFSHTFSRSFVTFGTDTSTTNFVGSCARGDTTEAMFGSETLRQSVFTSPLWSVPNAFNVWNGTGCQWQPNVACGVSTSGGSVLVFFVMEEIDISHTRETLPYEAMGSVVIINATGPSVWCEYTGVVQVTWE